MKTIVNIVDGIPSIMSVKDDWICRSVTGEYRPPEEFMRDGKIVRTNCERSYHMPHVVMREEGEKTFLIQKSNDYRNLEKDLIRTHTLLDSSVSIQDLIESLNNLQKKSPNTRILITQEGYYSQGKYAMIYPDPELECRDLETEYYSIGHSSQNY